MATRAFATTTRGLDRSSPPMKLWEKAKRLGAWNPAEIDFTRDAADWKNLSEGERDILLRLASQFQAGEEAVTLDLLPLIQVIAQEGRIEEEMFLTTFLYEEAKHVDFFHRFVDEVVQGSHELSHYMSPSYKYVFEEALPTALQALSTDASPIAQVRASTTYNMVVEGILAETGYYMYYKILDENQILPGTREGITYIKRDESRHIAYGIYLLSRLMAEDETLWDVVEETMNGLLPPTIGLIAESFASYGPDVPFGLSEEQMTGYAMGQFTKRLERVRGSRGLSLEAVVAETHRIIEAEDA